MTKAKFAITRTMTDIDALGALKAEIAALTATHDALEAKLRKRVGVRSGMAFTMTVYDSHNRTLNYARVRRLLGPDAYSRCWTENEYRTSRITKLKKD